MWWSVEPCTFNLSQTDRGELVCGNGIDTYPHYGMRSTLGFLESYAAHVLELFPVLHNVAVQRQWAGLCDMTPDYSPIISPIDVTVFMSTVDGELTVLRLLPQVVTIPPKWSPMEKLRK